MKTLAKKQQKTERASSFLIRGLLLFLLCTVLFSNANAQTVFGPILNSNPYNNKIKDVTLFEHDNFNQNFNGAKKVITQNTPNLSNMSNRTTGLAVPLGKKAILYEFEGYQGRTITLYPGNYSHLSNWNDLASSIKIETIPFTEPVAYFFNDTGNIYTNQVFQGFGPGKVDNNNMVCYDCFSKVKVIGPLNVIGYDYGDWTARSNEDNPFKEGEYNLADWGLDNTIASLDIINFEYALSKTVFKKSRVVKNDDESTIAVGASGTNFNVPGSPLMTAKVNGCFEASATQSFDAATTIGISTAIRTSVSVGVEGVASASIEVELAAKLETTLTSGNATTVTKSQCWEMTREIPVPLGCEGKVIMMATTQIVDWTIEKHYIPVDSNGDAVPGGKPRIVTGTIRITKGIDARSDIRLNDGCNKNTPPPADIPVPPKDDVVVVVPPADIPLPPKNDVVVVTPPIGDGGKPADEDTYTDPTTDPGDSTSDTNNQQDDSSNTGIAGISEIEFCDGDGTVVGFYAAENGAWGEYDDYGTARFEYEETKRDDNAIYLSDVNRQGVKIILNINTKEVLYRDNNNTTPFKIYTISGTY